MPELQTVSTSTILDYLRIDLNSAHLNAQSLADRLNRGPGGRETALCITKIEEAIHRLHDTKRILEECGKITV